MKLQRNWDENRGEKIGERPTRLSFNAMCQVEWKLRIFASFPFLIRHFESYAKGLPIELPKLDFSAKECARWRSRKEEKKSPYWKNLNKLVESSPKACWLYGFIRELMEATDVEGRENKLVIVTAFNVVGMILKLVCIPSILSYTFVDEC